jgi:putative hemolysin
LKNLSHAIDLTNDINSNEQEHQILKGIVKFGETSVKEVMTARVNVVSVEKETPFNEVIDVILDSGHSRIPVYDDSFDKILGILIHQRHYSSSSTKTTTLIGYPC